MVDVDDRSIPRKVGTQQTKSKQLRACDLVEGRRRGESRRSGIDDRG